MSYSRYKMLRKLLNGIPQDVFTQGDLIQVGPFDTYEECQEGNASPDVTPDTPDMQYRWVTSNEPWCEGWNEYKTEKQQQSPDNVVWTDTGATRRGEFVQSHSFNCGFVAERWVNISGEFVCENGDKYAKQKKQTSTDGVHWTDTGDTRKGSLIEVDSADCGYPQYRWVEIPLDVDYECVGDSKYYKEKEQITQDGITWSDTGRTRRGRGAEVHSADCGYVPPTTVTRWVDVQGEFICQGYDKYQKQKEQISEDSGQTWSDTGNIRAGSIIEKNSYSCGYVSYRWVDAPGEYVCQGTDKYQKQNREKTTDGVNWTPTGRTRTGALIERDSYDCQYVSYRWIVVEGEYLCEGTTKYEKEKQQQSTDGITWTDTGRTRTGSPIEMLSQDCGVQYQWVNIADAYLCRDGNKYQKQKEQYSEDNGITWTDSGITRAGYMIEEGSEDCNYVYENLTFKVWSGSGTNEIKAGTNGRFFFTDVQYRKNGGEWVTGKRVSVEEGDIIEWRGRTTLEPDAVVTNDVAYMYCDAPCELYGNINSLYDFDEITDNCYCYYGLFCNWSSSYNSLIYDASRLWLPHKNLRPLCFDNLFWKSNIRVAPELPATTLNNGCYASMFRECTSLIAAPDLPATTLATKCYSMMFCGCSSLTTVPILPAKTMAKECCYLMFSDCTSLTEVPRNMLPATELAEGCYMNMFEGCKKLKAAPELPAFILSPICYAPMFSGCKSLNFIKMTATYIDTSKVYNFNNSLYKWTSSVASTGIFVKHPKMTSLETGPSGIPVGWEVCVDYKWVEDEGEVICDDNGRYKRIKLMITDDFVEWRDAGRYRKGDFIDNDTSLCPMSERYLTTEILPTNSTGNMTFSPRYNGSSSSTDTSFTNIQYRKNGGEWVTGQSAPVTGGDIIEWRADNNSKRNANRSFKSNSDSIDFKVYGNINSVYDNSNFYVNKDVTYDYNSIFRPFNTSYTTSQRGLESLKDASGLYIPYKHMIPSACENMFYYCKGLVSPPALPATTLASYCYKQMFYECNVLASAPELPATTLASACYGKMFYNCHSVSYVKMLASSSSGSTSDWLYGVASGGSLVKNVANKSIVEKSASGIPTSWTVTDEIINTRWVNDDYICEGNIKYQKQIQQVASDNENWVETGVSRKGEQISVGSQDCNYDQRYLTFEITEGGGNIYFISKQDEPNFTDVQYRKNGGEWTSDTSNPDRITYAKVLSYVSVETGDVIEWKAKNIKKNNNVYNVENLVSGDCSYFNIYNMSNDTKITLYGNINSLYDFDTITDNCYQYVALLHIGYYWYDARNLFLPFKNMKDYAYNYLFAGSDGLTYAPALPATTLASYCYKQMFYDCDNLTNVSDLPAATLAPHCYYGMFQSCSKLTTAPEIHATTLATYCCQSMFSGCGSLTAAPVLHSAVLKNSCYREMFDNCSSLNFIKMMGYVNVSESNLYHWVSGVHTSTGTFVKNPDVTTLSTGISGIPDKWTVVDATGYETETRWVTIPNVYFCEGSVKYGKKKEQISYDSGNSWSDTGVEGKGDVIEYNSSYCDFDQSYLTFEVIGDSGQILFYRKGDNNNPGYYVASYFTDIKIRKNGGEWEEPVAYQHSGIINYYYVNVVSGDRVEWKAFNENKTNHLDTNFPSMFFGTTVDCKIYGNVNSIYDGDYRINGSYNYFGLFRKYNDTSRMISDASGLILPSSNLQEGCFSTMFYVYNTENNGDILTKGPALLSTHLSKDCYSLMFYGCNSLNYIKMLGTDEWYDNSFANWLFKVSPTGTFIKHPDMKSLQEGSSGIPSGWTVQNATS